MQEVVSQIFEALGGSTVIANGIGSPIQTVNDWRKKGKPEIPPWRRAAVIDFARREGKLTKLPADCLAYLQSDERTVGKSPAKQDAAA